MKLKLNLTLKFVIPVMLVFVLAAVFTGYQTNNLVKKITIEQSSSLVVDFVQNQARRHIDSPDAFSLDDPEKTELIFKEVLEEVKAKDVIRIKVWDKDGVIVFSDDKSIIGQSFADNHEFQEAINGEPEVEIKEPLKAENASEKGYRQLMEVYVPIILAGGTAPVGVIETYYNMDSLNESIKKAQTEVAFVLFIAFLVLAVVISVLFRFLVTKPLEALESGMQEIQEKGV